jgi:hypothetical protein
MWNVWEIWDNIKMDLQEVRWVACTRLIWLRIELGGWLALVNAKMKIQVL